MTLYVYYPSVYCQKVLMVVSELDLSVDIFEVDLFNETSYKHFYKIAPWGKVPLLTHQEETFYESSTIIDYLCLEVAEENSLIPSHLKGARLARHYDRVIDNYLTVPMAHIFHAENKFHGELPKDTIRKAIVELRRTYSRLDKVLGSSEWIAGKTFTIADCNAGVALNHAEKLYPFDRYQNISAYMERIRKRDTFNSLFEILKPKLDKLVIRYVT